MDSHSPSEETAAGTTSCDQQAQDNISGIVNELTGTTEEYLPIPTPIGSPTDRSLTEIAKFTFDTISRVKAVETLNGLSGYLKEMLLMRKNVESLLSQSKNGALFMYYMESGESVGDKVRVNRKTKIYSITSHPGPNSRYCEYRVRQYFSHLARRTFDKIGGPSSSAYVRLVISNMYVLLESKTKVVLESVLHHTGNQLLARQVLPYEVTPGRQVVLFNNKYVLELCLEIRVYSKQLSGLCNGLLECYEGKKEDALDVPQKMLEKLKMKFETLCLLSSICLSFDKFKDYEELKKMVVKNTKATTTNRIQFLHTSSLDTPENPGVMVIIHPDTLLSLQRELAYLAEQPTCMWKNWSEDQRFSV